MHWKFVYILNECFFFVKSNLFKILFKNACTVSACRECIAIVHEPIAHKPITARGKKKLKFNLLYLSEKISDHSENRICIEKSKNNTLIYTLI